MISMSFPLTDEKHREPTGRVSSQEYVESQRQQGVGGGEGGFGECGEPFGTESEKRTWMADGQGQ